MQQKHSFPPDSHDDDFKKASRTMTKLIVVYIACIVAGLCAFTFFVFWCLKHFGIIGQ